MVVDKLGEFYLCKKCKKIAFAAVSAQCGHLFCSTCAEESDNKHKGSICPACNQKIKHLTFSIHERDIIRRMDVKCSACNFNGKYFEFLDHICKK